MRVLLAACFVWGGVIAVVTLLASTRIMEHLPSVIVGGLLSVVMLTLALAALWLFNLQGKLPVNLTSPEERVRELESTELLEATDFRAVRTFEVQEWEDEGLHYFIELADGRVLYLEGQYLYEYQQISDDPELNQPRRFPCTDFTVCRHRLEGYVVAIQCRGAVLEPELVAEPFSTKAWREGRIPSDGSIITDRSYETLKAEYVTATAG
jgi:hypothetical protein